MGAASDPAAIAAEALEAARAAGATEAEAWVEDTRDVEVRAYEGEVESLTEAGSRGVGLRAFLDGRVGYAHGTDLDPHGLARLAAGAVAAARVTDPDEHAGLPEECGAADVPPLAAPGFGDWDVGRKVELALAVERAARAPSGISQVEDTVYADASGTCAIANSRGFAASYESTSAWAYSSAFAGEGAELMTGLGVGIARSPADLDPEAVGTEAAERALALRGARQPESRSCPVVLDPFVAASFVGFIGGMLSAEAVQRGRSPFAGREGDAIASEEVRLIDDGIHPDGPRTAPFDGEGSARRRTTLIEAGRLSGYLYDCRSARVAGRQTTAAAARGSYRAPPVVGASNLVLEAVGEAEGDLFARAGDGLYVTDVAGLHSGVNPVSGTFSVGASGRLIEGGEAAAPVREITIASDLVSMLRAIVAVGSDARWVPFGGGVLAPAVLIESMSVGGR